MHVGDGHGEAFVTSVNVVLICSPRALAAMAAPPLPRWLLEFAEFLAETQEKSQRQTCWRAVLRLALGFGYKLPSSTSAVAMHPASAPCFAAGVRMLEDEVDGARLLLLAERWLERNGLEASSATLKPLRTLAHFCAQRSAPAPKPPRLMAGLGSFATARESSHGLRLVPNVEHTSWAVELGASDDAAGDATAPPSLFVCSCAWHSRCSPPPTAPPHPTRRFGAVSSICRWASSPQRPPPAACRARHDARVLSLPWARGGLQGEGCTHARRCCGTIRGWIRRHHHHHHHPTEPTGRLRLRLQLPFRHRPARPVHLLARTRRPLPSRSTAC